MKNLALVFMIICFLFLEGCKAEPQQKSSLKFNVDPTLLGEQLTIDSLDFSFSTPLGWSSVSNKILQQVRNKIETTKTGEQPFDLNLVQFFLDSASVNFCSLSQISLNKKITFDQLIELYGQYIQSKFPESKIKKGDFEIDKRKIYQFLITTTSNVQFKLIFEISPGLFFQLDYAIDRNEYPNYIQKIESSIGSISFTK